MPDVIMDVAYVLIEALMRGVQAYNRTVEALSPRPNTGTEEDK